MIDLTALAAPAAPASPAAPAAGKPGSDGPANFGDAFAQARKGSAMALAGDGSARDRAAPARPAPASGTAVTPAATQASGPPDERGERDELDDMDAGAAAHAVAGAMLAALLVPAGAAQAGGPAGDTTEAMPGGPPGVDTGLPASLNALDALNATGAQAESNPAATLAAIDTQRQALALPSQAGMPAVPVAANPTSAAMPAASAQSAGMAQAATRTATDAHASANGGHSAASDDGGHGAASADTVAPNTGAMHAATSHAANSTGSFAARQAANAMDLAVSDSAIPAAPYLAAPPARELATPAAQAALVAPSLDDPRWPQALGQHMVRLGGQGNGTAELDLNPPHLGPLKVVLNIVNDQAQAQFVSPHPAVRAAVEAALPQLRTALAESGIHLGQSSVGAEGSGGQAGQGQPQRQAPAQDAGFRVAQEDGRDEARLVAAPVRSSPARNGAVDTFA